MHSIIDLQEQVVVVTGGCGLIGKEFVQAICQNNGIAVIADINSKKAEDIISEIKDKKNDTKVIFKETDIISKESIEELIGSVDSQFGRIDSLVNSAYPKSKNYGKPFLDIEYSDFCENVNIQLGGYFLTTQIFSKYFLKQGYGNVINLSSIYGVVSPRFEIYEGTKMTTPIEYAAVKSGLILMTKYCAKYFKGKEIRFNCITPGGILDNQAQSFLEKYKSYCLSKGMLDKNDLCGALLFLLSDMSKYINGQNIIVDDGFSL